MTTTDTNVKSIESARAGSAPTVDFVMEGAIKAVGPIHVTSADARENQKGVITISRQVSGQAVSFPIIKGETIKGALRECATELAIELLRIRAGTDEQPLDLARYYNLKIGGVKGSEKQKPEDTLLLKATIERNPIAQIFGNAAPYWIPGAVSFGMAYAQQPDAIAEILGGARRDKMLADPSYLSEFSEEDQQAWLSYSDTNKAMSAVRNEIKALEQQRKSLHRAPERTQSVQDEIKRLNDQIDDKKKLVKDTKGEEFVGETISRPLPVKRAIAPGAVLDHKMRGNALTLPAFGFFLKTLEKWADNPRIGGHESRGFGEISAEWSLRARINEGVARGTWVDAGTIALKDAQFTLPNDAMVSRAIEAFSKLAADTAVDFDYAA
jgi:hypothetical protein